MKIINFSRTWLFEENIYEKLGLLMLDQGAFSYSKYIFTLFTFFNSKYVNSVYIFLH